jgi:protease-4
MKNFFLSFFGALTALIVFAILAIVFIVAIASAASSKQETTVAANSVLVIDLSRSYLEQQPLNPLAEISGDPDSRTPSLYELVSMIKHATTDASIRGIYIKSNASANGFASAEALRDALNDFKKNKKFVIAYGDYITQGAYYVASVADKVYCNPKGMFQWKGMAVELSFMKRTLEKLEIHPQIFYAGKFKSATEPLREEKMTDANRLQTTVLLNDIYGEMLSSIGKSRNIDTATLSKLANEMAIETVEDAVKYKLIDAAKYDDQVKAEIREKLGLKKDAAISFISTGKYADAINLFHSSSKDRIAVIYAEGEIVYGKGEDGQIGSDDFRKMISKVRTDNNVKAVVLRVNSPGGSSLASEIIWRELSLLKKEKPLIVSMGNYAASGGYYISCDADSIFAEPNTLTGSIGVFSILPDISGFMTNKLGITFDGVKTGNYADFPTITRPLTDAEKSIMQRMVDNIYTDFKTRVSAGRKKEIGFVDSIAQGRVWTGKRAIEVGLVDRLGNMDDALAAAAKLAKLKDYKIKQYPEPKSFWEQLFKDKSSTVVNEKIKAEIGEENFNYWKQLKYVRQTMGTTQARMPFDIRFN